MGASTYSRSSYDGKGSSRPQQPVGTPKRETDKKSPMIEMLDLLAKVEACREKVESIEGQLKSANEELAKAENAVKAQLEKLDPQTRNRLSKMMGGLGSQTQGDSTDQR